MNLTAIFALVHHTSDQPLVVSGGVVTDAANCPADSKVDVTAVDYIVSDRSYRANAVTDLAVTNGQHVYVDPADNTIKAGASTPSGAVKLATVAVSMSVCTPTAKRTLVTISAENGG